MMAPQTAFRHWAAWAVDDGSWRKTCAGLESRYANDPERYSWPEDKETAERRLSFRYDKVVGESVEDVVNRMQEAEKRVLRARHVWWPHLADEIVARALGMSRAGFDTIHMAAHANFCRRWRALYQEAA